MFLTKVDSGRPNRTSNRFNKLGRALELTFLEPGFFSPTSMANHCRSWHLVHSTSFSLRKLRVRFPQARQAIRSANRTRPLGISNPGWLVVTERSKLTTSTGEIVPAFRLTCSSRKCLVSTKSQRTKKSTYRLKVASSSPEASSKALADSHLPSGRTDQTASRNIAPLSPMVDVSRGREVSPMLPSFAKTSHIEHAQNIF